MAELKFKAADEVDKLQQSADGAERANAEAVTALCAVGRAYPIEDHAKLAAHLAAQKAKADAAARAEAEEGYAKAKTEWLIRKNNADRRGDPFDEPEPAPPSSAEGKPIRLILMTEGERSQTSAAYTISVDRAKYPHAAIVWLGQCDTYSEREREYMFGVDPDTGQRTVFLPGKAFKLARTIYNQGDDNGVLDEDDRKMVGKAALSAAIDSGDLPSLEVAIELERKLAEGKKKQSDANNADPLKWLNPSTALMLQKFRDGLVHLRFTNDGTYEGRVFDHEVSPGGTWVADESLREVARGRVESIKTAAEALLTELDRHNDIAKGK